MDSCNLFKLTILNRIYHSIVKGTFINQLLYFSNHECMNVFGINLGNILWHILSGRSSSSQPTSVVEDCGRRTQLILSIVFRSKIYDKVSYESKKSNCRTN